MVHSILLRLMEDSLEEDESSEEDSSEENDSSFCRFGYGSSSSSSEESHRRCRFIFLFLVGDILRKSKKLSSKMSYSQLLPFGCPSDYTCPTCQKTLVIIPQAFYYRGTFWTGLVCPDEHGLWENPEDHWGLTPLSKEIVDQKKEK